MISNKIDSITLEVMRNKLEGIANEMQQTLLRSSYSPIVKEGRDASASLFTTKGETLAQSLAIPAHLAMLIPMVRQIIESFPPSTMRADEIYLMNDPYLGGTHLPDLAVVKPVFVGDQIIAFSACITHHQDVGGMTPGSLPTNATEIFQEGLRIPPIKLYERGVQNETFTKLLRQNVRVPDMVIGDLNAQVAAVNVGTRRLVELAAEHGSDLLTQAFSELLDRSEEMTREALRAIPPGTYRFRGFNDNDGVDLDKRIAIEVTITAGNGNFHCDFKGSSEQVRGPFNCPPSSALAAACFVIRAITGPQIPTNGGCFRPISLTLPEGSIVNPKPPAPVNARIATTKLITSCMLGALASILPKVIPAASSGDLLTLIFGGIKEDGQAFVVGEMISGGTGASDRADGVDGLETDVTNAMNLPVEAMEPDYPIFVHRLAIRQDSGGSGRHRGGLGLTKEYEVLRGPITLIHRGERHFVAPWGLAGGEDGVPAQSIIHRAGCQSAEVIPSKMVTTLFTGDRLIVETPGGGGFGKASERDPSEIARDLAQGKQSVQAAAAAYGTVAVKSSEGRNRGV